MQQEKIETGTIERSERMKRIDSELDAMRTISELLDALPDDEARVRVLAAVVCLYDDDASASAMRAWKRKAG
jgi:Asp/Glu/hydantoin racemase